MTPDAVDGAGTACRPQRYPELAALVGETSDNLPGVPGVGPKTAAKWITQYDGLDNVIANADEIKGKAGDSLPRAPRRRDPQPPAQRAGLRPRPAATARPTSPCSRGTARRCTRSSTAWSSGCCASGCSRRWSRRRRSTTPASTCDQTPARAGRGGRLARPRTPHGTERVGVHVDGHLAGRAPATSRRSRSPRTMAPRPGSTSRTITPEDDAALGRLARRPDRPKVLHDAKGPMLALAARGWQLAGLERDTALSAYLARPDQRSYDLADLTLRYLKRELKAGSRRRQGQLTLRRPRRATPAAGDTAMLQARAVLDLADALDDELEERGGTRLLADVELPLVRRARAHGAVGIAVDVDHARGAGGGLRRRGARAADAALRRRSARRSTSARPSSCRWCSSTSSACRRPSAPRPATPPTPTRCRRCYEKTEHPFLEHLLRHRDVARLRQTVEGLLKTVADDGRIHTTFNQLIAATGRLSCTDPNLQNIPVRTEEGRRIREAFVVGPGLRVADDRRLQPDRDADHGAPVRGRRADRGVPVRPRLPLGHRGPGLRGRPERGHRGDARQDQGDELRPRLRPVRVRPVAAAAASTRARRGA